MDPEKIRLFIARVSFIGFCIAWVASLIYVASTVWYGFQNPELTLTQLIIHLFTNKNGGKWIVTAYIFYIAMNISD